MQAIKSSSPDFTIDGKDFLAESRETLEHLADKYGATERAPLLAHMELAKRLDLSGRTELFATYWKHFGHKGTFLEDVHQLLPGKTDAGFDELKEQWLAIVRDVQVSAASCIPGTNR